MEGYYRYYRIERLPDRGTDFPWPVGNRPVAFLNFYEQRPVEGGAFLAWGELWYERPLPREAIDRYGLRPSPQNPNMDRDGPQPIAEQLAEAERLAQEHKTTLGKDGSDRVGEEVTL